MRAERLPAPRERLWTQDAHTVRKRVLQGERSKSPLGIFQRAICHPDNRGVVLQRAVVLAILWAYPHS
jgi:hypothetical protein